MSSRLGLMAVLAMSAVAPAAIAGTTTFDFSTVTGTVTPLTLDGATFSSSPDAGGFTAGPNGGLYSTLPAFVLSSAGSVETLKISFAAPVTSYSFDFALGDFLGLTGDDSLTVTADVGGAQTFTSTIPGSDDYPQGVASGTSAGLTSLTLTSTESLAIGNLSVTAAAAGVPEPATMAVLGAGLLGLFGARRRG